MAVRHHIKVLVVDDDPQVCKTVAMILQEHDYQVQAFSQPRQALQAVRKTPFDIALIDIKMPDLNGLELVEKIKAEDPRVAPVVMTAYPDVQTAAETMRLGCRDYITKPFREEQLLSAVERVSQEMGLIYTNEQELNRLIGQRIRQERLKQSLTLRQLSDRSELTTSQLSQVELGKNAASVWALARISGSLGKQLCELLAGL
ncbi:MAG TPA: response regulator [Phycisphaerae bacterium]|jgi:DNA-binding NtrC family response regulator|nr:response regulator [Phycisphaerae bacterium]HOB76006.1 response regulator [Phycisphaerae bacterium]HOJ53493.1 response regulator [Phycisphaerae bacterium]HOL25350.1 response regulator [Phycisphaerae bacterium]HPP21854.1 response regulator [Phycisphaerae bacterium]